ncbi:hypothetical protein NEIELOOT_00892 [Neisseria elongata subsp. glycolytica ATCC 29315]|uniref:Uncharacterized protein n=1 Tax=Neisseria elongata subsp. glycolytica ATCC 29315 TaxID=546263 RepID=D4DPA7_NEIEG|nr:hypothetical protein NEIELOOT_00892 [Neisseria elongata subsp. glycolytica ATCC 29315]
MFCAGRQRINTSPILGRQPQNHTTAGGTKPIFPFFKTHSENHLL